MVHGQLHAQLYWWELLILAVALMALSEIGYFVGKRHREKVEEQKTQASVHVAALLGLLGLMLAFSFSVVEQRFAERRALVLEEANAIGTAYLRAEMLPAPFDVRIAPLFKQYVDVRVNAKTPVELQRAIEKSEDLQTAMWTETRKAAAANPRSLVVSNFVEALNDMMDLFTSRVTVSLYQRMPGTVLVLLYTIAALAVGVIGLNAGLARSRAVLSTAALVLAITAVVTLIVDLDNPGSRLFHVSQSAMVNLRASMEKH